MSQGNTHGVLKERTGYYFRVRRVVISDGTGLEISIRKGKGKGIVSIAVCGHFSLSDQYDRLSISEASRTS